MVNNPLVSVIIPVYNVSSFLVETIESVLNQTLSNIEIILVNDGSTDGSDLICKKYKDFDRRIKYIKQENSGVSIARNNGLLQAKGIYIYFMDSDDTIDKNFIKSSYDIVLREDSDIVVIGEYYCDRIKKDVMVLPTWAQLISHNFLKKHVSIRFPENIQPCEDGLFSHQLLVLTNKVSSNPDGIYYYREHENQNHHKINENSSKVLRQIPSWFKILEEFYKKYKLEKSHVLHLALFLEHEPFELRYLEMFFNNEEKKYLHKIIRDFYQKNICQDLKKNEFKKLSKNFRVFLEIENHHKFDRYYINYLKQKQIKKLVFLKMAKLIFLKKYKRKLITFINQKYS